MKENAAWTSYPRPQCRRSVYVSLNGTWKYNDSRIKVPFAPESVLSGFSGVIKKSNIYTRTFMVPEGFDSGRILLYFGAVDQIARVWLNDSFIGEHEGGYLPFSFDITEQVKRDGENLLRVEAEDDLSKDYPYGKQCKNRGGMWYTPVSGIWQSVWLECVPDRYIKSFKITPDLEGIDISIEGDFRYFKAVIKLPDGDSITRSFEADRGRLILEGTVTDSGRCHKAVHWSCDNPHLYDMELIAGEDKVETYFALRTIEIKNINGINRVCLNGKPIFMHGVLDQGYYENGIYTPESAEEYEKDILRMKELGFNMLRKHIKIEPEAFYYYCDKHGMLVMQDMVNSGEYSFFFDTALPTIGFKRGIDIFKRTSKRRKGIFIKHTKDTIVHIYNHPCIVAYTIFNEGWGQFDADEMYDMVKGLDSTRLIDATSGWFAHKKSDFDSQHIYFRTIKLKPKKRPLFVTECGGFAYKAKNHCNSMKKSYGYGTCKDTKELTDRIIAMYNRMIIPGIKAGVCGCIYTQLSDVEDEINGLYTYDREICKVEKQPMQELSSRIQQEIHHLPKNL